MTVDEDKNLAIWGQKPHSVWLAIMVALNITRPERIIELGAGKSTRYFAEYAQEFGATFRSIEQNPEWVEVLQAELKASRLDPKVVMHVPLVAYPDDLHWYDSSQILQSLEADFDAWLIDGPIGASRRSKVGQDIIRDGCHRVKLLIVDDLQRRHIFDFFEELVGQVPGMELLVLSYFSPEKPNLIGFAAHRRDLRKLRNVLQDIGVSFTGAESRRLIWED